MCVQQATDPNPGSKRTSSVQQETLWKYKRTVKDPIKRLALAGDSAKQVIRVAPIVCSEPGISWVSRGDRISQKIWVANYRDAQGRKRNKWYDDFEFGTTLNLRLSEASELYFLQEPPL